MLNHKIKMDHSQHAGLNTIAGSFTFLCTSVYQFMIIKPSEISPLSVIITVAISVLCTFLSLALTEAYKYFLKPRIDKYFNKNKP